MRRRLSCIAIFLVSLAAFGQTAEEIVKWSAHAPSVARVGSRISIKLQAHIQSGWHIYSVSQMPGGPTRTTISVPSQQSFKQDGLLRPPTPHTAFDPNFNIETETYEGTIEFKIPLRIATDAPTGVQKIAIEVLYQACNETTCLPPHTKHLIVPVKIERQATAASGASTSAPSSTNSGNQNPASTPTQISAGMEASTPRQPLSTTQRQVAGAVRVPAAVPAQQLGSFLWLAMGMGALSLLTPCVFPMVPITVSYFTNHAKQDRKSAITASLTYGIGIILTFTALGLLLALIFGAAGVNQLAANPWVNLLITVIFLGFAFSLFGAYFFQVPPSVMNKLDAITRTKLGSSFIGPLLMGFTFTLTSFTCTAPFVGTLLVITAQGNWRWPLVGMLAFSSVFAIPFIILALAPQLMSRLPKSGGWMVSVKVIMGFLEIAAAMKFLSNADLVWHWGIFTRQVVLAVWVGIGLLTVLYILGYFRMEHDSPVESVGAARVAVAIIFLTTTIWLVPGLFGRQLGELESFLPPELSPSAAVASSPASSGNLQNEAGWILNDFEGAVRQAKLEDKLLFVDFTGYTCTNCRWMEANMFPRPEVASELNKFVRVRLYTDGAGEMFERQQKMQQEQFGTVALPYYAILRTDGSAVDVFPGLTRKTAEFLTFLQHESKQ
jgi:thiol:disulfide interchange protein